MNDWTGADRSAHAAENGQRPDLGDLERTRARIGERVVGRERELDLLLAAVSAGRDVLLEGPPGTSKSTILRAITADWGIPLELVEGNADLTPAKLIGQHDPARVLQEGYRDENFVDGPLLRALRTGGFLYVEELNRAPDDTLNTLLTVMAERVMEIPRLGSVEAEPTFRVVASMNPYDTIGTSRLSMSVYDRFNRLAVTYQDAEAERAIVRRQVVGPEGQEPDDLVTSLMADAVSVVRATREHPDVVQGSSVRGAIDLTLIAIRLLAMRGIASASETERLVAGSSREAYAETVFDAILLAL